MSTCCETKEELQSLIEIGKSLHEALNEDEEGNCKNYTYFADNYEVWYSKSMVLIKQLLPERFEDFKHQYADKRRKDIDVSTYTISDALRGVTAYNGYFGPSTATCCILNQLNMLKSCLETFDSKIYNIQTLLQADIFDSEIDSAKHLLKRGFLRAAGAVCGVLIEKHFSIVCQNHNIALKKKSPTIADYNDALKDNVYDTIEWRRIQRLGDLRNLCDHNKDREPTKDEVEELISGTERIIKTIF